MKKLLIFLLFACFVPMSISQNIGGKNDGTDNKKSKVTDEELPRDKIWVGTFPHGQYMIGLGSIITISKHVYVLDSAAVVSEVNIDTAGAGFVRFYYVEPITEGNNSRSANVVSDRIAELTDRAAKRIGGNVNHLTKDNMVFKQYPTTSHAKTIEFRVSDASYLDALYNSVTTAWRKGVGRSFQCE